MVLLEGEDAGGVTVDRDDFVVGGGAGGASDQVLAAIIGTRESAREGGYRLSSTGVTWTEELQAALLRDALAARKIENVMLISAFLAAVALAQEVGSSIHYDETALLFVEPDVATLAVVNSADGSIAELHRQQLPRDDDRAVAELSDMVAGAGRLSSRPDGLFVVGSGVDVAMIKPELERVSTLPVSLPAEPELALARGAALASAHAPLFSSSTQAMAWAQDHGTGTLGPGLAGVGYAYPPTPADYDATEDHDALAYSAAPDEPDSGGQPIAADAAAFDDAPDLVDSRLLDFRPEPDAEGRKPFLVTGSLLAGVFLVGVAALAVTLAINLRPSTEVKPNVAGNVITHSHPAPAPVAVHPPAPAPPVAPPPAVAPAPVHVPAPAPVHVPAPAPAPAPPPPAPVIPPIFPQLPFPGLPGGPHGDDDGGGGWGHGRGGGHGRGQGPFGGPGPFGGGGIKIPLPFPGVHGGFGR